MILELYLIQIKQFFLWFAYVRAFKYYDFWSSGKLVRNVWQQNSIKISDLTISIYFIQFKGDNKTINSKFVKE
jgi:hypothetical protein